MDRAEFTKLVVIAMELVPDDETIQSISANSGIVLSRDLYIMGLDQLQQTPVEVEVVTVQMPNVTRTYSLVSGPELVLISAECRIL